MALQGRLMDIRPHMLPPDLTEVPEGFCLSEVEVRLATSDERTLWDALMVDRHYLGFNRFTGRGLRYIAVWRRQWLALGGWQVAALKCRPRDRWIGWKADEQFRRLHMVANNTRCLVLAEPGVMGNLASFFMSRMTRRLCDDWMDIHGHGLLIAESFVDPSRFVGSMYRACGWQDLGNTKGFARCNGHYTDPHDKPKRILVHGLRRDARRLLARPEPLPADVMPPPDPALAPRDLASMRSLYEELASVDDFRRKQGMKHTVACVLTLIILATFANMKGCMAVAQFARALSQEELEAIGAWKRQTTGLCEPVSKSTVHRVLQSLDPEALEDVLKRYARPRFPLARALAADGKRIRGANRNGTGHHETVSLVDHMTGAPVALLGYAEQGGEIAATHDLLERSAIAGKVITIDALHTTRATAQMITRRFCADYMMTVKGNAPETFALLESIDWQRDRTGHHKEDLDKAHGRLEQRQIDVMTPLKGLINYPGIRQIARVRRTREQLGPKADGTVSNECAYVITSLGEEDASPAQLLALNRGHWCVENANHRTRDTLLDEDACLTRTRHGPLNRASLNNIALAVVFAIHQPGEGPVTTMRRLQLDRGAAIRAVCEPPAIPG